MKHPILKQLLGLAMGLFCIQGYAQIEIKSKVTDFMTFQPIESANIYVQNTTKGTITNADGNFVLLIPEGNRNDTLVISSIGYKSFKAVVKDFDATMDIFLEEDVASLDEVVIVADPRPKTGNDIVLRAIRQIPDNLPGEPYLQKGFLRHRERNKKEYKWLIESAISLYDSSYASGSKNNLRINVDEKRKSYDLRDVDSLFTYTAYLNNKTKNTKTKAGTLNRNAIPTSALIEAIKWNDTRVNGLENLFKGRLNLVRNANMRDALFGEKMLDKHQFDLDTILVDDGRKLYKIKISKSHDFVGLNTENIYNEGYEPQGWLYIYWDNYAFKKIEYELVAASEVQKKRSKSLFDSQINHKLVITYMEFEDKMYPNYFYYETPKLVNTGERSSDKAKKEAEPGFDKGEQYYFTIQEILFTEIIKEPETINLALQKKWSADIFSERPYNAAFWKNYNVLLESEEEGKFIEDLSERAFQQ